MIDHKPRILCAEDDEHVQRALKGALVGVAVVKVAGSLCGGIDRSRLTATFFCVLALAIGVLAGCASDIVVEAPDAPPHIAEMVAELRSRPVGAWDTEEHTYPLPVATSWANGGEARDFQRYSTQWQLDKLLSGHRFMPTLPVFSPHKASYGDEALKKTVRMLAALEAPISIRANQPFTDVLRAPYKYRTDDTNPRAYTWQDGVRVFGTRVSPWGPTAPWYEVGFEWMTSPSSFELFDLYPDPPLVVYLDNNEAWGTIQPEKVWTQDARVAQFGSSDELTIDVVKSLRTHGLACLFRNYLAGVRDGVSKSWRNAVVTVAYEASYNGLLGFDYREHDPAKEAFLDERGPYNPLDGRWSWHSLAWDGSSPPYYLHDWDWRLFDFNVRSPRFHVMNAYAIGAREDAETNPDHFVELSVWDGGAKKYQQLEDLGQTWSAERYLGFVRWGMWVKRPQVVREFRASQTPVDEAGTAAVMQAVDEVWEHPVLRRFWRNSKLVVNPARPHPLYRGPDGFVDVPRMFLLEASTHPETMRYEDANVPRDAFTEIPVWALARKLEDEYLLFADAPLGARTATITVPGWGAVVADAPLGGGFWLLGARGAERVR